MIGQRELRTKSPYLHYSMRDRSRAMTIEKCTDYHNLVPSLRKRRALWHRIIKQLDKEHLTKINGKSLNWQTLETLLACRGFVQSNVKDWRNMHRLVNEILTSAPNF